MTNGQRKRTLLKIFRKKGADQAPLGLRDLGIIVSEHVEAIILMTYCSNKAKKES